MILYQNCYVIPTILLCFLFKFLCILYKNMYKNNTLSSIPEINLEEEMGHKWVPKKKHEVLKAKYKCLKKLFQIYDATVVGILPEQELEIQENRTRRKRSHRTKTDACAGTEISNTNLTYENTSIDTGVMPLELDRSCISTQFDTKIDKYAETIENDYRIESTPYLIHERRRLTRFQCFVQRLFGIRREINMATEKIYSASESVVQKRRKRGLRFRRLRRTKRIKSDGALRDLKSPILSYVQCVQRNCLLDRTSRPCPMPGCNMVLFGIINYNDHLNLCHLKDRKYICHYCHEGFENEANKTTHENGHIGINKLNLTSKISATEEKVSDEKLKKIVSFFDKFSEEQISLKKDRVSESNLRSDSSDNGRTRTINSCCNIRTDKRSVSSGSVTSYTSTRLYGLPIICHFCGENFHHRRQLSLHVNLEHRIHDKYSKYHSCAGIIHPKALTNDYIPSKDTMTSNNTHLSSNNTHLPSNNTHLLSYNTNLTSKDTITTKNTQIPSKDTHLSSKDAYLTSNTTHIPSKDTHIPSKDTHIPSKDTHLTSKDGQICVQSDVKYNNDFIHKSAETLSICNSYFTSTETVVPEEIAQYKWEPSRE